MDGDLTATQDATTINEGATTLPKMKHIKETERTIEELADIDPKKMTDKEKNMYIKQLRFDINCANILVEEHDKATKSAFAKARNCEEELVALKRTTDLKMNLIRDTARVLGNNIMTIIDK
jgi:hypothetical protein